MAPTSSFILQIETVAQKWCDANINETCIASAQLEHMTDVFHCQIMTADRKIRFPLCTRHQIEQGLFPHIALDLQYQLHRIFFPTAQTPTFTLDELNAAQDMINACNQS